MNSIMHGLRYLSGQPSRDLGHDSAHDSARHAARHGGLQWHVLPAGAALFGPDGPDLERWRREGRSRIIKAGSQRTIERVDLPGGSLIVKSCRVNGPRAWWREVFRGSKAKLEFDHALALKGRGLATAEPLAWARASRIGPCTSLYISRWVDGVPLQEFLERNDNLPRRMIATALGRMLARMHDAGVAHPDPHPGNLLITFDDGQPSFTLIDLHALHALRIGAPLPWAESLRNLVLFNRYFQLRTTRTDRLAFWNAYVTSRLTLPIDNPETPRQMARDAERLTAISNARFWQRRLDRYLKTNRQYCKVGQGQVTGHAVRGLPEAFIEHLLADPDAPFRDPEAKFLKDSRSSTVIEYPVPTPTGVAVAIYKRFRVKSSVGLLKNLVRPSPALRSWSYGHNLLDRGLPTARPLLVLQRHRGLCPAEGYLLTERVPHALELSDAVARGPRRAWFQTLGRLIRQMHDKQVAHRDLKAANILLSHDQPVLIDLVGVEPGRVVRRQQRIKNLARLNASFLNSPHVTRTDRLRFLRAYLAWGLHGRGDWKTWWIGVARETDAKVAKNRKTGRPLT